MTISMSIKMIFYNLYVELKLNENNRNLQNFTPPSSQQSYVGHHLTKSCEPWGGNTHEMALVGELN